MKIDEAASHGGRAGSIAVAEGGNCPPPFRQARHPPAGSNKFQNKSDVQTEIYAVEVKPEYNH